MPKTFRRSFECCGRVVGQFTPIVSYGAAKRAELERRARRIATEVVVAQVGHAAPGLINVKALLVRQGLGIR
jgi:hypothetical protein